MADDRTYIKVHDGIEDHPKILPLSDGAFRLLVTTWCWSSKHLTDGHVPAAIWGRRGTPKYRRELVTAGLAEETEGGVLMHDYLDHQRSAAQVEEIKQARAVAGAKANHIRHHESKGVRSDSCPYCATDPPSVPSGSQNGASSDAGRTSDPDPIRSPETETETETKKGDKLPSRSRASARTKSRGTKIPDDLDLSGPRARYAHDHGMTRDVAHREFATFRAWHTAKGTNDVHNWDQAWLTWVLRWEKNTPKPQVEAHPDLPEGWA